jgi:hypothetical protein
MVGSGIRKKPIPDPGSGGQKGPGSGSATLLFKFKLALVKKSSYHHENLYNCTFPSNPHFIERFLAKLVTVRHKKNYNKNMLI